MCLHYNIKPFGVVTFAASLAAYYSPFRSLCRLGMSRLPSGRRVSSTQHAKDSRNNSGKFGVDRINSSTDTDYKWSECMYGLNIRARQFCELSRAPSYPLTLPELFTSSAKPKSATFRHPTRQSDNIFRLIFNFVSFKAWCEQTIRNRIIRPSRL